MTTLLRVLLGTAVYALIVTMAAPFPQAAGLMLTFPALNGLAFVFAEPARVAGMARSMLWMPVLNGVLCAGYILAFLLLARAVPPAVLAWTLTAAVAALWAAVAFLPRMLAGIAPERQRAFALAATLLGVLAVAAMAAAAPSLDDTVSGWSGAAGWRSAGETAVRNGTKIALFALCLAAFLVGARALSLSDGVLGILAGLPFVPFAGLLSIAGDDAVDLGARLAMLERMAMSIWLAPAIAIWFIYGFSRWLDGRPRPPGERLPGLVAAWALCGAAVAAVAWALP